MEGVMWKQHKREAIMLQMIVANVMQTITHMVKQQTGMTVHAVSMIT